MFTHKNCASVYSTVQWFLSPKVVSIVLRALPRLTISKTVIHIHKHATEYRLSAHVFAVSPYFGCRLSSTRHAPHQVTVTLDWMSVDRNLAPIIDPADLIRYAGRRWIVTATLYITTVVYASLLCIITHRTKAFSWFFWINLDRRRCVGLRLTLLSRIYSGVDCWCSFL